MSGDLAPHLQAFFTERLLQQRQASEHTIASYRDSFRLLLSFVQDHDKKAPSTLSLQDLDAPVVVAFLQYLEQTRGNSTRSRNVRLAAIHSFFRFVAFREPGQAALIQRVLAIPTKRAERHVVDFLTREESKALLAAPDTTTRMGRRDHTLLRVALQTGFRVSELVGLLCADVHLGHGPHIRCLGKGRKNRHTPISKEVVNVLRQWIGERGGDPTAPLFPSNRGTRLSADGIRYLLEKYVAVARALCPTLAKKRVSPHTLRHTTAVSLLESGVDQTVIALWLGHESVETTQVYLHASLQLKERALARIQGQDVKFTRYRPDDTLLAFLQEL